MGRAIAHPFGCDTSNRVGADAIHGSIGRWGTSMEVFRTSRDDAAHFGCVCSTAGAGIIGRSRAAPAVAVGVIGLPPRLALIAGMCDTSRRPIAAATRGSLGSDDSFGSKERHS